MIKIGIYILDGELDIEIKQNEEAYFLTVILSKSAYFKESGRVWHGKTTEKHQIEEIVDLIKACFEKPSVPTSITINDGRMVKIELRKEELAINLKLKDIEEGMLEFELMEKIFGFVNGIVQDEVFKKYSVIFGE